MRGGQYGGALWRPQLEVVHLYKEALLRSRPRREVNREGGGGWTTDNRVPRAPIGVRKLDFGKEDLQGQMRNLQRELEDLCRVVGRNMEWNTCRGKEL